MRYFITLKDQPEREVDRHRYTKMEIISGFLPKRKGEIATSCFSNCHGNISGRVEYDDSDLSFFEQRIS